MKLLLALFALTVAAHAAEFKPAIFLEALAQKETGVHWNGEPGPCGELSRWQLMPAVWRQHMGDEPFENARVESKARLCVLLHLYWLFHRIESAGVEATPERLATCWHYGHTHRRSSSEWGREVANLYEALSR